MPHPMAFVEQPHSDPFCPHVDVAQHVVPGNAAWLQAIPADSDMAPFCMKHSQPDPRVLQTSTIRGAPADPQAAIVVTKRIALAVPRPIAVPRRIPIADHGQARIASRDRKPKAD